MVRAVAEGLNRLRVYIESHLTQATKILAGNGTPGTRATPPQSGNKDVKIGVRLDNGERYIKDGVEFQRIKLQVNKNAENATLKTLAAKDSHKVWSQAGVPIDGKGNIKDILKELEANLVED